MEFLRLLENHIISVFENTDLLHHLVMLGALDNPSEAWPSSGTNPSDRFESRLQTLFYWSRRNHIHPQNSPGSIFAKKKREHKCWEQRIE
jgi:hypothetical protein